MDNDGLAELLKYSHPNELWVVTWYGKLKVLNTPFKVCLKTDIGSLKRGHFVAVEAVKITKELKTVFIIKGQAYYCHYFNIIID